MSYFSPGLIKMTENKKCKAKIKSFYYNIIPQDVNVNSVKINNWH